MTDLRISRPFGVVGGMLYILIAISCVMTAKKWVDLPVNRALAGQLEKQTDMNNYPGGKEEFDRKLKAQYGSIDRQININFVGALFWSVGLLLCFFRSLWSPICVVLGVPFKIWSNAHLNDPSMVWIDVGILVLAAVMWQQWQRHQSGQP